MAVSARARTQICNATLYPPPGSLSPDKLTVVVHVTTSARLGQLQQVPASPTWPGVTGATGSSSSSRRTSRSKAH